ncbi:MAG: NADPH-dependent FMN reductase [Bacteroidia bacterium]
MSKKILVFGASSSKNSINKQFASFVAGQLTKVELVPLDLNDFELPLYSIDLERKIGIPKNAKQFSQHIQNCDAIVASFAEHNGLFTTAFKNLWDWMSRLDSSKIWHNKPIFLLSASVSKRPQNYVTKVAKELFPHYGGEIIASFYLPSYHYYFKDGQIVETSLEAAFQAQLHLFQQFLTNQ